MPPNVLIYFVKYPEPGKVKTRLARQVGPERAAEIYRILVESNLRVLAEIRDSFRLVLAFGPFEKEQKIRKWLEPFRIIEFLPQEGAHLGERLEHAFRSAFQTEPKQLVNLRVMALGSDTLGLKPKMITEGFEALNHYDCVIGPAKDGGYYLIGLQCEKLEIFRDIPWSTSSVYQNTIQNLERERLTYYRLPELDDLDDIKNVKEVHL